MQLVDFVSVVLLVGRHRELGAEEEVADGVQQRLGERHRVTTDVVVDARRRR